MERRKKSNAGASQKACLFKIDNELLDWLDKQPNKGRYVNELIRRDMLAADSVGYAAAVEAEARRQSVADFEIDGELVMRLFTGIGGIVNADTLKLFQLPGQERYDALFSEAREVKRMLPAARITTAEAEDIKLEGCMIARIDKAGLGQLEAALDEAGRKYCIIPYPTKTNTL